MTLRRPATRRCTEQPSLQHAHIMESADERPSNIYLSSVIVGPAFRSRLGLIVVCVVVVGPVLVCVCAGGYTSAAEDDGASIGPDGKQLWPRAWMPAMTAALKEPLSRR